jgi:hypothetical protein
MATDSGAGDPDYQRNLQLLRELQLSGYAEAGLDPALFLASRPRAEFDARMLDLLKTISPGVSEQALREQLHKDGAESSGAALTEFEDPRMLGILLRFAKQIEDGMAPGKKLPAQLLFGTVPSGRVNAMAVRMKGSRYRLIILDAGLFGFANLVAKAVAAALPVTISDKSTSYSTLPAEVDRRLASHPEPLARFADVILAYVVGGNPQRAQAYLPTPDLVPFSSSLRAGIEAFVVAHEYGHCLAGHFDDSAETQQFGMMPGAERILTDWQKEFEADGMATLLTLKIMTERGYDPALSLIGADLFFACIGLVYETVSILQTRQSRTEEQVRARSHPPPALRRAVIYEIMKQAGAPDEAYAAATDLSQAMSRVTDAFWAELEPQLHRMHAEGVRPAPAWQDELA